MVITAGPAIRGTPIGTIPTVPNDALTSSFSFINSRTAITRRISPPAILKSLTVIPRILKTASPTATKVRLTARAVSVDCLMTLFFSPSVMLRVSERNIGIRAVTSIATKRGINVFGRTLKISSIWQL